MRRVIEPHCVMAIVRVSLNFVGSIGPFDTGEGVAEGISGLGESVFKT
jgi:hypothetical protein